jgi:hypothetical protein
MRRRLVFVPLLAMMLAGCTSAHPTVRTASASAPAAATAVSAVVVPSHLKGEISRDVYTGSSHGSRVGKVPAGSHRLKVHLSCAGSSGAHVQYVIKTGSGKQLVSGSSPCDGHTHIPSEISGKLPPTAAIHLTADSAVINGWVVLTRS